MGSVSSVPGEGAAKPGLVGTGAPDALSSFLRDFFLAGHQAWAMKSGMTRWKWSPLKNPDRAKSSSSEAQRRHSHPPHPLCLASHD